MFLWVALIGVLVKVMMRGRPISLKSMQQQQELQQELQRATCSSSSSMPACNLQQQQQQQKQHGEQFHVAQEHLCA